MIPFARVDPAFAKEQLVLFLREWYMHPNGQLPAYEWALSDVNPPVHAWACWRVYKMTGPPGQRDRLFLSRVFQKLLINFTWWVNRKDIAGKHLFAGGFLGLDNIGMFDRSRPLPSGGHLEQADGTAWMAFYCATMLAMALELARDNPATEDVASKFFEHFVAIAMPTDSSPNPGPGLRKKPLACWRYRRTPDARAALYRLPPPTTRMLWLAAAAAAMSRGSRGSAVNWSMTTSGRDSRSARSSPGTSNALTRATAAPRPAMTRAPASELVIPVTA